MMRRSDIKQLRRRLTCAALRVWQQYTYVERKLSLNFTYAQSTEKAFAADGADYALDDHSASAEIKRYRRRLLDNLADDAKMFGELATWYKSGHEQLNQMIREADTYISWELTD